jgi:hypothetical protein
MYTKEMLTSKSSYRKIEKGVLNKEQAIEYARCNRAITTLSNMSANMFFFSDNHCFGNGQLPPDWVPCSQVFPSMVTPREGLEDGLIDTIEKFVSVFQSGDHQVTSMDELLEILNKPPEYLEVVKPKPFFTKEKKGWNIGHFPIGTVAKCKLSGEDEFEFTVTGWSKNGARSYVLITEKPHEFSTDGRQAFNMLNVTAIVKRGDGAEFSKPDTSMFAETFISGQRCGYLSSQTLVCFMMMPYLKQDMLVDADKLALYLVSQGLIRYKRTPENYYPLPSYNKKQLRKAVKRLLNKFLVRHKVAEKEERESYARFVEADWKA